MAGKHVTIIARIRAREGKEEIVRQELLTLVGPTRAEEGCIKYDLHQAVDDNALFVFYESWASQEAIARHLQSPHIAAILTRVDELLAGPPEIKSYEMISQRAGGE
jgi:quinol monooxygenase YgiN